MKSPRFSDELTAWRMARLKATADQYQELPENFRRMMAKAARIPEGLQLARLDAVEAAHRADLLAACKRLRGNMEKAWPLLIQANPPTLPV